MLQNRSDRGYSLKEVAQWLSHAWVMPACFLMLGIVTRLPFRAQLVQEWDAGCFALAVEHYDVRLEQPHRPGTFIVYIFLARCLNWFLQDATASLVMVSVIATSLAASTMFILGQTWFDRRVGWVAASLMLASPIVWFYGEMALSYLPEFCWVLWIVLAATYTCRGSRIALWVLAILMGLAGGIRPNTPIFLLPLALWALASGLRTRKFGWRQVAMAVLLGLVALAAWMIPLFETAGGAEFYWGMVMGWLEKHSQDSNSWQAFSRNLILMVEVTLLGVGLAILPLLAMAVRHRSRLLPWLRSDWRSQAFMLWILPGSFYLLFVHIQRYGHAFTVLPALILLAALAVVAFGDWLRKYHRHASTVLIMGVIGCNALIFPFGPSSYRTWQTIRYYDTKYSERIEFIRSHFPPQTTSVLAHTFYGRLPDLYLPAYQERHLSRTVVSLPVVLPAHVRTLVLLDNKIYKGKDQGFQKRRLPRGGKIRYLTWSADQQLKLTQQGVEIERR